MSIPAGPADDAAPAALSPFPSLAAMRAAHAELLQQRREAGLSTTGRSGGRSGPGAEQVSAAASAFLRRGQAAGAHLDDEDERVAAQSLLTYWANALQRLGHEVGDAILAEFDPDLAPELPDAACPYVGLDAFSEADHSRFFGREAMVDELLARLAAERLLVVAGPSGSGKSSLVRAGLIPALRAGRLPGSAEWRYLPPVIPGGDPLATLAGALLPGEGRGRVAQAAAQLRERPAAILDLLGGAGGPALLVVDQLEELFTIVESEDERDAFLAAVLALADAPAPAGEPGHSAVLTLRSDFEPLAAAHPRLAERLARARAMVTPLGAAELRQAIEAPAAAIGLKFEGGVVDLLVQEIVGEPAGLPLLQFTLLKLWELRERNRITLAAYEQVGGGRQALARSADAFYSRLIPEEQATLKRVLLRMVRPGEGVEVTSSRVRLDSLYALGEDPGRVERVVRKLVGARLLRLTPGDEQSPAQVEVAHEALVRNRPRLVDWLEDEKLAIATRRQLEQRAQEWQRLGAAKAGLLDEAQLREAQRWLASSEASYLGYDPAVSRLVYASGEALREAEADREAARRRELQQARALAVEQAARAEEQAARAAAERRARNVLRVLGVLLAAAAMVSFVLFARAQELAVSEAAQRAEAQAGAATNVSLAATSDILRQTAEAGRAAEALQRQTAEAATTAEALQRQAAEAAELRARAGELAAQAEGSLAERPQLALLLAVESVSVGEAPEAVAIEALRRAVESTQGRGLGSHTGAIRAAAASADGALLATAGEDGVVRLWGEAPGPTLSELGEPARHLALSADGAWLAVAGPSKLLLYSLSGGAPAGPPSELPAGAGPVSALGISPGATPWLIAADEAGAVRGWRLGATPGPAVTLGAATGQRVRALAFTPDGRFALTGGADRVARLWNLGPATGLSRFVSSLDRRARPVSALAVSPDGGWMAAGADDGSIHIWRLGAAGFAGGPAVKTGHQGSITALAFSPDSRWLLSGSADRNARLWAAAGFATTSAEAIVLTGHSRPIVAAGFSPDGQQAVTAGADRELLVWRLADPSAEAQRLRGHDGPVTALLLQGGQLRSAGEDGQLRQWELPPETAEARAVAIATLPAAEIKALACTIAGRNLSDDELQQYFGRELQRGPTCPAP